MDIRGMIRRHPARSAIAALLAAALFVSGMLWFTPWRLFTDDRVNESLPIADRAADPADETSEAGMGMRPGTATEPGRFEAVASGEFVSLEHESHGIARVLEDADGTRFLRFERFETSNGPDLVVYLSTKDADPDDWHGYDADFVDLGPLKGNVGNQNYRIPKGVDLENYSTAVVWCRRFTVGFAAADLA